jgi:hypothetical protein
MLIDRPIVTFALEFKLTTQDMKGKTKHVKQEKHANAFVFLNGEHTP